MVICNFCGRSLAAQREKDIVRSLRLHSAGSRDWEGDFLIRDEHICEGCVKEIRTAVLAAIRKLRTAPVLEPADAK